MKQILVLLVFLNSVHVFGQEINITKISLTTLKPNKNTSDPRKIGILDISYEIINKSKDTLFLLTKNNSDIIMSQPLRLQIEQYVGDCNSVYYKGIPKQKVIQDYPPAVQDYLDKTDILKILPNSKREFKVKEFLKENICADKDKQDRISINLIYDLKLRNIEYLISSRDKLGKLKESLKAVEGKIEKSENIDYDVKSEYDKFKSVLVSRLNYYENSIADFEFIQQQKIYTKQIISNQTKIE